MKLLFLILFLISCSGCWEVSDGERTGTITKLNHEGLFFKTWSGEIIMGGVTHKGTPNIWYFGLDSDCKHKEDLDILRKQIYKAMYSGKPVTVKYSGEFFVAPWRSSSDCMIYSIKEGGD